MGSNLTTQAAEFTSSYVREDEIIESKYRVFHNASLDRIIIDQFCPVTGVRRGSVSMDIEGAKELRDILNRMLDDRHTLPPTNPRESRPTISE